MIAIFLMVACDLSAPRPPDPEAIETTNEKYPVRRLFEVDGCTVYRFTDADKYRYFTRCVGAETETMQGSNDCRTVTTVTGAKPRVTTRRTVCEDGGSIRTESR